MKDGSRARFNSIFNFLDPRVADWPLMDTPMKTIGFLIAYLISLRFIREHMANKNHSS